jgi:hypothetical protein
MGMSNINKSVLKRRTSRTMQVARRIGIEVDVPKPHLPITEQEQSDIM